MTAISILAWVYLAAAAYTSLLFAIIARAVPKAAKDNADQLGVSVPVLVLGVGLAWFATLPIIIVGVVKETFRRR